MGDLFRTLLNAAKAKITPIWTRIKMWTSPSFIKAKVITRIRDFFSELFNLKPRDSKDYYSFFNWLVSKRLVIAITVVIGLLSIFYIFFINPPSIFTQSGTGIRTYDYDSIPLRFTDGEVRILAKSKYLAYEGNVSKGKADGKGTLYSEAGVVVYQGDFANSMYNGQGNRYYDSGQLMYVGTFVDNEFSGNGKLYRENRSLEYDGSFVDGMKEGSGVLYDEGNNKIYNGEFAKGNMIYSDILGKTTQQVSDMYTGKRVVYTGENDFVVSMSQIDALYHGKGDSNNVDGSIKVEEVYVLKDTFAYGGKNYSSIYDIRDILGKVEYEGNTYVTMADATAIHILNEKGNAFFGDIEGVWTNAFDDAVTVEEYDVNYSVYLYSFHKDGIIYNFYCKDRTGLFSMYSIEQIS